MDPTAQPTPPTAERRRHPRFPFHSKGELVLPAMAYRGTLLDISLYGALFGARLEVDLQAGTPCVLQVLNLNDEPVAKANGVIAHSRTNLIGIEFAALDAEAQYRLRHISTLNLAPPKSLERELPALLQARRV